MEDSILFAYLSRKISYTRLSLVGQAERLYLILWRMAVYQASEFRRNLKL